MVTLHEVITFLVSMQISISSLQTHNVNRCGRSRHLARKLSLRRKRSSPNVVEMAATETITSIILIKLIRVSLGTVRHPRRFKIVVIDIQITLKQMLRDFLQNTWPYGYSMPIAVRYTQDAFSRSGWLWPVDAKGEPLKATSYMAVGFYVAKY